MPLRNVLSSFTIEQQRLEINALAGDVNNIETGVTAVANATTAVNATNATTAATANALAAGATGADLTLSGTLTVNGTQTILNTATLEVEDKNIVIAKGSTTDAAASGGGITLKGADDKTLLYDQSGDEWQFNKPLRVEGSQGYASSANNLATSVTKAAFRVKGSTDSSDSLWMGVETTDANPYIQGSNGIGNNAKKLLLNPFGGNVGVNLSNPDVEFHVLGGGTVARFEGTGGNGFISLMDSDDSSQCFAGCDGGKFLIQTSGDGWANKLVVDTAGNVGLGIDNPNWPLTVQRSSGTTTIGCKNTGGNANLYVEASDGNTAKLELVEAGTGSYSLQVGNDNALMFFDDAVEKLRITNDKVMTSVDIKPDAHQQRDIGTASNSFRDIYSQTISTTAVYDSRGHVRRIGPVNPVGVYDVVPGVGGTTGRYVFTTDNVRLANGMTAGDVVTIINNGGSDITIDAATNSVTLTNSADASTGNRTLASKGMATVLYVGSATAFISGAGLS